MGRKTKFAEGTRVRSVRLPKNVDEWLSNLPNASEFIQQAICEKAALEDDVLLQFELDREKARLREYEELALKAKRDIDHRESTLQRRTLKRLGSHEARLKYLALLSKMDEAKMLAWLSSRSDVMAECGFQSLEEALEWVRQKKATK